MSDASPRSSQRSLPATRMVSMAFGAATIVGHAFSYGFSLVLSRALGPSDFGAIGALLGLAVVASVPAVALQTQVARAVAIAPRDSSERTGYRLGWWIGAVLLIVLVCLAVPLAALLRLDSPLAVVWLGVGLVAATALGARQGVLLGRGAFLLLAAATIAVPALRFLSAGVAAATGFGVTGAVALQSIASWVGLLVVAWLVGGLPSAEAAPGRERGPDLRGVLGATWGLLGLFALTTLDVLLARVYLEDADSGLYAVGAIGAKVIFWGSQFAALLVFPRVARREGTRGLVLGAAAMILLIGGVTAVASVPLAGPALELLVGGAYVPVAGAVPWFVVLGTMLALVQLFTYAGVAAGRHLFSLLIWIALGLQAFSIAVVAHSDIAQVLGVSIACLGLLASAGALLAWRAER